MSSGIRANGWLKCSNLRGRIGLRVFGFNNFKFQISNFTVRFHLTLLDCDREGCVLHGEFISSSTLACQTVKFEI